MQIVLVGGHGGAFDDVDVRHSACPDLETKRPRVLVGCVGVFWGLCFGVFCFFGFLVFFFFVGWFGFFFVCFLVVFLFFGGAAGILNVYRLSQKENELK